jgi:DNA-binding NtrC family response regulator
VAEGRFRADLFYRFSVVASEIPAFLERIRLIPGLTGSPLAEFSARNGRQIGAIAPVATQALLAHSSLGNVRELRNMIERAVALCPGDVIDLDDLPEHFQRLPPRSMPLPVSGGAPDGVRSVPAADRSAPGAGLRAADGLPRPPFR